MRYSHATLAVAFHSDGASFTYFGGLELIASFSSLTFLLEMINAAVRARKG